MKCTKCDNIIKEDGGCNYCLSFFGVYKHIECCDGSEPTQSELNKMKELELENKK